MSVDTKAKWQLRWWDLKAAMAESAGLWKMLAYVAAAVLLASVLSLPYFQPEEPWPTWLCVVGFGVILLAVSVVFDRNRRR